jgi:hypothetical protein
MICMLLSNQSLYSLKAVGVKDRFFKGYFLEGE